METATEQFVYVTETDQTFDDAVVSLRSTVEKTEGWGILGDYYFSEILNSKGFKKNEKIKSIDICAPGHASKFLDEEPLTGLCMPCSVLVFTDRGTTKIASMLPGTVMPALFGESAEKLGNLPDQISEEVKELINKAAAS